MKLLVSDYDVEYQGFIVKSRNDFFELLNTGEIDLEDLIIDVCSVSEQDYIQLKQAVGELKCCGAEPSAVPEWYTGSLIPLREEKEEAKASDEELAALSKTLGAIDQGRANISTKTERKARVYCFGSAKGGSGKTGTSTITAVYYARLHPEMKVAMIDFDIEEPQLSICFSATQKPSLKTFYADWSCGNGDFETMHKDSCVNLYNDGIMSLPKNFDLYLTPRDTSVIKDMAFWKQCLFNLIKNYDAVIIDTGTSYMTLEPIIFAYKLCHKLLLVTSTDLQSSVTVSQQIDNLTGKFPNSVYSADDGMEDKINIICTRTYEEPTSSLLVEKMDKCAPVICEYGLTLSPRLNEVQLLGKWELFANNEGFLSSVEDIYA